MWKPEHRVAADRRGLRYPSDLTDAEWAIVAPMIPPGRHGGRRRSVNVREVLNGIFYVLWTCCQWKALPKDLPPKSTVHDYLELWNWDGTLERIHHALYVAQREEEGREASPTVAIIDSQTVPAADTVPRSSRGWDGGKRTNGVKRHLAVDVNGLLLTVVVTAASIQDRDAAHRLLAALRGSFSTIRLVWADGGYPGRLLIWAKDVLTLTMQIIKRLPGATGFHVRPRIWVVERSFG